MEPIAIVGMGCRLPGGVNSPSALWELLTDNRDALGEVPPHRWESYAARGPDYAKAVRKAIKFGGYLEDIEGFDADFFGISPREAELMDPQQRVTLEVAWETLENAGIAPSSLAGSDTSIFMGVCTDDYGRRLLEDLPRLEAWTGIGNSMCAVANRVSYALDLRGPSVTLDTACSASLVAVHQACQSLRSGETSLALAGGVMLVASPSFALVLDLAGALSPDGTSKAWDAAANGYVRSEGCAVLALKRLADAERDGDQVLAVVRGSAVCQDGRTNGIMAPSAEAQAHLVRQACHNAGVSPASLDYVEAHGTGTGVGDPMEISALSATVGSDRSPDQPCLIGSVKTNIGHLEAASGVAGIIKLVLSLRNERIPATLSRAGLNPNIPWDTSGLKVVHENTPWPRTLDRPRRGGTGNYGYGGTLAHVIIEEAPATRGPYGALSDKNGPRVPPAEATGARVFPLSGASNAGLRANAARLAAWLATDDTSLSGIGYTLAHGRSALGARACVVATDRTELATRLEQLAEGRPATGVSEGQVLRGAGTPAPVWVFSGHGAQWVGMGRDLLRTEPLLGQTFDEIDEIYRSELGISPRQVVLDGDLEDVGVVQAMTFAVQVGLARIWRGYGLEPAAIIGHSVGEIAAAVAAGMLDLASGARLICRRSALLRRVAGDGAMALLNLPFDEVAARLAGHADVEAAIAASPVSTVISGGTAAVEQLIEQWQSEGLMVRRVNTDVAFHSAHMDGLVPDLLAGAAAIASHGSAVPTYSTALDDPRANPPRDAEYWAANLRNPVRFAAAVSAAIEDGHRVFLEVSTHPVVAHSIMETLSAHGVHDGVVVSTLRRNQPEQETLLTNLGALHCVGVPVDWSALHPTREAADLPTTAWQHRRYWAEAAPSASHGQLQHDVDSHTVLGHHVLVQGSSPVSLWQTRLDDLSKPYPGGHKVLGAEILPAAVVLTTFLAAAEAPGITDVELRVPVTVTMPRDLQVVRQDGTLRVNSRLAGEANDQSWLTHATARVLDAAGDGGQLEPGPAHSVAELLDPECVMDRLRAIGVVGIGFPWQVTEVRRATKHLLVRVAADPDSIMDTTTWGSLFDAGLSAAPILFPGQPRLRMPGRLREVSVYGDAPREAVVSIRLGEVEWTGDQADDVEVDVTIADLDGTVLARLLGAHFGVVQHAALPEPDAADDPAGQLDAEWHELPDPKLHDYLDAAVRGIVSGELRLDPDDLDGHRPLSEMGVDSLLSESIRQRLSRQFRIALPSSLLWDRPSVSALAGYLAEVLAAARTEEERAAA